MSVPASATLLSVPNAGDRVLARFRRTWVRVFVALCFSVFFLIGLGGVLQSDTDFERESLYASDSAGAYALRAFAGVIGIAGLLAMIGWLRMGIVARRSGLTIRNLVRTQRIPWNEIERFEPPESYGTWRDTGLQVHLHDGNVVFAFLYSPGPFSRPTFADDVIDQLEGLRRQLTDSDDPHDEGSESPADNGSNDRCNRADSLSDGQNDGEP